MIELRFDLITAYNCEVKEHPQKVMKELGYDLIKSEPVPIGDCWIFTVEKVIEPLPKYLTIV